LVRLKRREDVVGEEMLALLEIESPDLSSYFAK